MLLENKMNKSNLLTIVILLGFYFLVYAQMLQDLYDSLPLIYKGDTVGYEVEIVDFYDDEDAYDITNYIIKLRIKPEGAGESYILDKSFTNTTPTSGLATLSLTSNDTTYINGLQASGEITAGDYLAYFERTNANASVKETMKVFILKFKDR